MQAQPETDPSSSQVQDQVWKFWKTQPVPEINEDTNDAGEDGLPIIPDKSKDQIKKIPYKLPEGFEWTIVDVTKEKELEEVYHLLNENYVEDEDAMFRFDYSRPFLKWALMPPDFDKSWHLGVRTKTNKLVAFISGIPVTVRFSETSKKTLAEINFLCVHKILRKKRVAPVLIKEITRRINLTGIFQVSFFLLKNSKEIFKSIFKYKSRTIARFFI